MAVGVEFKPSAVKRSTGRLGQNLHLFVGILVVIGASIYGVSRVVGANRDGIDIPSAVVGYGVITVAVALPGIVSAAVAKLKWLQIALFAVIGFAGPLIGERAGLQTILWLMLAGVLAWEYGYFRNGSRLQRGILIALLVAVWTSGGLVLLTADYQIALRTLLIELFVIAVVWVVLHTHDDTSVRSARRLQKAVDTRTAELQRVIDQRDDLLRELHHQTKTSLQIVSSVLSFESEGLSADATRNAIHSASQRIHALARLHEDLLVSTEPGHVDLARFVDRFSDGAAAAASEQQIRVYSSLNTSSSVTSEFALRLGLLLNEIIDNLLHRYGASGADALLCLSVHELEGRLRVTVSLPHPPNSDGAASHSANLRIAEALVSSMDGTLRMVSEGRMEWSAELPVHSAPTASAAAFGNA